MGGCPDIGGCRDTGWVLLPRGRGSELGESRPVPGRPRCPGPGRARAKSPQLPGLPGTGCWGRCSPSAAGETGAVPLPEALPGALEGAGERGTAAVWILFVGWQLLFCLGQNIASRSVRFWSPRKLSPLN